MIRPVRTEHDWQAFGDLVGEYVASLPFPLDFQDVEGELARVEEEYGPPQGQALLAEEDAGDSGGGSEAVAAGSLAARAALAARAEAAALGCVAIRALEPPGIAELKRMYVRPQARGRGLGRQLASAALDAASDLGYEVVRLDTVAEMAAAGRVYRDLGFVEIGPYRHNPLPTARFYEVRLGGPTSVSARARGPSASPPDQWETPR